ncbi:MAG: response regulator [Microvirga sp.]
MAFYPQWADGDAWDRGLTARTGRPAVAPSDEARPVVVLVVEDELLVRMSTTDILQDSGFHVVEARDGVEAIAVLELRDDVAAILTDVAMPNMNGVALAAIVAERWSSVGIVITSGAVPAGLKIELPAGARFIQKPYTAETLLQEIAAVLPRLGAPVALKSLPTMQPGKPHGAGGIAQPLAEPDES